MTDPTSGFSSTWVALNREAGLSAHSLSGGLTQLYKAQFTRPGQLNQAFFGLSVGLERLMKLIFILDHLSTKGTFPTDKDLRSLGHDLTKLYSRALAVPHRVAEDPDYPRGDVAIQEAVLEVLSTFSTTTQYFNLNLLAGNASLVKSPEAQWFDEVGGLILQSDISERTKQKFRTQASDVEELIGSAGIFRHTSMSGTPIRDAGSMALHGLEVEAIQRRATFHTGCLARFLVRILQSLNESLYGNINVPVLWEHFSPFLTTDEFLKRKTFVAPG